MKTLLIVVTALFASLGSTLHAADENAQEIHNTAVVESGTCAVTAERGDPEFAASKKRQKLEATVEKSGQRLKPVGVKILE